MRLFALAVVVIIFAALPVFILNTMVMPELQSLQNIYSHSEDIAARIAGQ
jgi:type II secretory pathway component PulF